MFFNVFYSKINVFIIYDLAYTPKSKLFSILYVYQHNRRFDCFITA